MGVKPRPPRAAARTIDPMLSNILGIPFGPLLVAAGSVAALLVAMLRRPGWLVWVVGLAGPFCLACALYLWPLFVYSEETLADYGAWVVLLIIIGTGVGLVANALAAISFWAWRRQRRTVTLIERGGPG